MGSGIQPEDKKGAPVGDWNPVEYEDANGNITADNSSDYVIFEKTGISSQLDNAT